MSSCDIKDSKYNHQPPCVVMAHLSCSTTQLRLATDIWIIHDYRPLSIMLENLPKMLLGISQKIPLLCSDSLDYADIIKCIIQLQLQL